MSGTAFSQTLQYITGIKLQELERQRDACRAYVDDTLKLASVEEDPVGRVSILLDRIRDWNGLGELVSSTVMITNYDPWLYQARHDGSISSEQVSSWATTLETELRQAVTRYDYAKLFGDLLNEWISSGDSLALPPAHAAGVDGDEDESHRGTSVEKRSMRQERFVQQERIQELIFSPRPMSRAAITSYLDDLFASSPEAEAALEKLRKDIRNAGTSIRVNTLSASGMRNLIKSLLARDLLSAEKAATLKSFLDSDVIIEEVTSVLNMQMARLDDWEWPGEGVKIEMRRHLSGKYRAYMDTTIIEALLFQHIGMEWCIKLKAAFKSVLSSSAWLRDTKPLKRKQLKRRHELLGEPLPSHSTAGNHGRGGRGRGTGSTGWGTDNWAAETPPPPAESIEAQRHALQLERFFMTQLPSDIKQETPYDEEPKAGERPNQGVNAQQVLLRLVSTEAALRRELHGTCTIMRADLEWFGPSLPHDSILAVFEFYGMSERWLAFFEKWLNANLLFDGASAPRTRSRGVPIAHALSVLCGEAVLFGMDFAVNQRASGLYVYRIYDDFWFYHHDPSVCAAAWKEMKRYAELVGIKFNMKKTGGVCVGDELEPTLPKGVVGWGFLVFDAEKGRFVIDQAAVDVHIAELKRQLDNAKSVFGYVNALNKYLEFFRRNFGQPAPCFGKVHAEEMISTFGRIQRGIFPSTGGSVVRHIRETIEKRFGIEDIPAGWCFLPISEGGLEIVNPIIDVLTVRDSLVQDPTVAFSQRKRTDEDDYRKAEDIWRAGGGEGNSDTFMSWDEFVLGRETVSAGWGDVWKSLQVVAAPAWLAQTGAADRDGNWYDRSDVGKWVMLLYADEILQRFGTLKIVEPTLIPVGMLSAFRSSKIAWDQ